MALVVKVTCREEMEAGRGQHVVAVFGTFRTEFEHSMNRRDLAYSVFTLRVRLNTLGTDGMLNNHMI